jgi:hypothetical protein
MAIFPGGQEFEPGYGSAAVAQTHDGHEDVVVLVGSQSANFDPFEARKDLGQGIASAPPRSYWRPCSGCQESE